MQSVQFIARNNFGAIQRIAGIFSRRGIAVRGLFMNALEGGRMQVEVQFDGDERMKKILEAQFEKLLDFVDCVACGEKTEGVKQWAFITTKMRT